MKNGVESEIVNKLVAQGSWVLGVFVTMKRASSIITVESKKTNESVMVRVIAMGPDAKGIEIGDRILSFETKTHVIDGVPLAIFEASKTMIILPKDATLNLAEEDVTAASIAARIAATPQQPGVQ